METEQAEHKNEKQQASDTESTEKKTTTSKRQLDHLKYAREMKRLKKAEREHEVNTQNKNLDFIYKRLTNIENNVANLVESRYEPHTSKRNRRPVEDSEDLEKPTKKKKTTKIQDDPGSKPVSNYMYDTLLSYAGRGLMLIGGTIALSVIKSYAAERQTTDREPVGGYYPY